MPPLPDASKVVKVLMKWSDTLNNDILTRFYVRYSGTAPTDSELANFTDDVSGFYGSSLKGLQQTGYALIEVEATDLSSPTAAFGATGVSIAGTRDGGPIGAGEAVVISYEIQRRYRGGHPRGYFPFGVSEDLQTQQTWAAAFTDEVDTSWAAFFVALEGAVWSGGGALEHVNISYYQGFTVVTDPITGRARNVPTPRGAPVVDIVSGHIVRTRVGTQRRRLQYG